MKKKYNIILTLLIMYTLFYRFSFSFYGDLVQYIINPLIWGLFTLFTFLFFNHNTNHDFKYKKDILDISIISSILYIIFFHALGLFTGFAHNPYKINIYWLIINFFSIIGFFFLKEYIRSVLINARGYHHLYYIFVFLLFFIIDIDLIYLIHAFKHTITIIDFLLKSILPTTVMNLFMFFLVRRGGFLPSFLYQVIITLPSIIFPIVPKNEWYIYTLFNLIFPLFTYLIMQHLIDKEQHQLPVRLLKPFSLKKWLYTMAAVVLIILFGMGFFTIRPIVIISQSMQPNINPGDILIIKKISIDDVKKNDIIEYKMVNFSVAHRIIEINNVNNKKVLITKGDNNPKQDPYPVSSSQLIGKSIGRIPLIGYPIYWLRKILADTSNINVDLGT